MPFQKGIATNIGGNPNIGIIAKTKSTGPTSLEGKFRQALAAISHGQHSKLIKKMRVCQRCVLGARTETITVNGRAITKSIPAKCNFYMTEETHNGKNCVIPLADFINQSKLFLTVTKEQDTLALQESVIQQSLMDAIANRDVETLTRGAAGFYTKEFQEQALKYLSELNKIKFGQQIQKHQHIHVGEDVADKMIDAMFENQSESPKIE